MATTHIRIATRESALALWQANFVKDQLQAAHPDLSVALVGMTTKGDQWLQTPLSEIGGKGLFIKELEVAMLQGKADLAVHSVKDLPAYVPDGFELPLFGFRDDVRDAVVSPYGDLMSLPEGARVGSSSPRRKAQLLASRPDLDIVSIRGNVGTRLGLLDEGKYHAIVLAQAGLSRLEVDRTDTYPIATELCLPAPGQGALGIETLTGSTISDLLAPLLEPDTMRCVLAERAVSAGLGADCSLPIAANAEITAQGDVHLKALVADDDGATVLRGEAINASSTAVAAEVISLLYDQGAARILDALTGKRAK